MREFCLKNGLQPANISKYERGLLKPPCPEKIHHWLSLLRFVRTDRDSLHRDVMMAARDETVAAIRKRYDSFFS